MGAFVVLAVTLAVFGIGVVVISVRELLRNVRALSEQVRRTNEQLGPLTEELQAELAVTSVEMQGLSDHVANIQRERAAAPNRRNRRSSGRKR